MKIELFIFDMGDVLIFNGENIPEIARYLNIEPKILQRDYDKYDYPLMEGYMDTLDYMRHLESEFGIHIEGNLFSEIYTPYTNTSILPVVERIREKGGRVVIGSNTFRPHVDVIATLPEHPLSYFDRAYFSHEMHITKPSLSFFSYILEKENIRAERAFFIDDRKSNTDAAESIGIKSFLYTEETQSKLMEKVNSLLGEE